VTLSNGGAFKNSNTPKYAINCLISYCFKRRILF